MKNKKLVIGIVIVILIVVVLIIFGRSTEGAYDEFAQCLGDSGATFYGAFWCSHCNDQKALFGNSAKKLPYTECSTADRRGQLKVCQDADIEAYPTWEFADGSRESRVMTREELAEKTGCALK